MGCGRKWYERDLLPTILPRPLVLSLLARGEEPGGPKALEVQSNCMEGEGL